MKNINLLLMCFALFAFSLNAQDKESTKKLNSELSSVERQSLETQSKQQAKSLFNALVNEDKEALKKYFPSKEVYIKMINEFGFKTKTGENQALADLERHYANEQQRVNENFEFIISKLNKYKTVNFSNYMFVFKENVSLAGGRAAIMFTDENNVEHVINIFKYYEYEGHWYVTNKLRWFK